MNKTELTCLKALYGNGKPPTAAEIEEAQKEKAVRLGESEHNHQRRLHTYLKSCDILHFAPANEGKRTDQEGQRLKVIGFCPGIPDVWVMVARKPFHALILELKQGERGQVSGAQLWWLEQLNLGGYKAVVSWSFEESIQIVAEYMALEEW